MTVNTAEITEKTVEIAEKLQVQFFQNFDVWMNQQLLNNDFLIAGVFTVLASAALYMLRHVPGMLWRAIKHRCTYTLTITSDNEFFEAFCNEVNKKPYHFISRDKTLDGKKVNVGFGRTFSKFLGSFVIAYRVQEESDSANFKQKLIMTFPLISYKKLYAKIGKFIEEISDKERGKVKVYNVDRGYLFRQKNFDKRLRESVFCSEYLLTNIETRVNEFEKSKSWYIEKGIPYKYAILLYGPPGTGKTTLAKYIASYTGRSIIVTDPNELPKIAQAVFSARISTQDGFADSGEKVEMSDKFVCLLEDIDCYNITKDRNENDASVKRNKKGTPVIETTNLSKLLNSIDGLNSPDDTIIIATTNNLQDIDPALIRKGRFDDVVFIGPLESEDIKRMIRFYVTDKEFNDGLTNAEFEPITGAELQDILINHYQNPKVILEKLNPKYK